MKTSIASLMLAMVSAAWADLGTPRNAVEAVIRQAQNGQVVGVNLTALGEQKKHALNRDSVLKLLKGIDPEKLVFQAKDEQHRIYWFTDSTTPDKSVVRLLEPKRLDFEVTFVRDDSIGCGGYHEITSIHP